mmetsp:Transcript_86423/g.241911  ORF Transcript_86423/g.241911 Transcript_86423/m.241911 type:complete len:356 (+) Transcript_86423:1109-2176(+)
MLLRHVPRLACEGQALWPGVALRPVFLLAAPAAFQRAVLRRGLFHGRVSLLPLPRRGPGRPCCAARPTAAGLASSRCVRRGLLPGDELFARAVGLRAECRGLRVAEVPTCTDVAAAQGVQRRLLRDDARRGAGLSAERLAVVVRPGPAVGAGDPAPHHTGVPHRREAQHRLGRAGALPLALLAAPGLRRPGWLCRRPARRRPGRLPTAGPRPIRADLGHLRRLARRRRPFSDETRRHRPLRRGGHAHGVPEGRRHRAQPRGWTRSRRPGRGARVPEPRRGPVPGRSSPWQAGRLRPGLWQGAGARAQGRGYPRSPSRSRSQSRPRPQKVSRHGFSRQAWVRERIGAFHEGGGYRH